MLRRFALCCLLLASLCSSMDTVDSAGLRDKGTHIKLKRAPYYKSESKRGEQTAVALATAESEAVLPMRSEVGDEVTQDDRASSETFMHRVYNKLASAYREAESASPRSAKGRLGASALTGTLRYFEGEGPSSLSRSASALDAIAPVKRHAVATVDRGAVSQSISAMLRAWAEEAAVEGAVLGYLSVVSASLWAVRAAEGVWSSVGSCCEVELGVGRRPGELRWKALPGRRRAIAAPGGDDVEGVVEEAEQAVRRSASLSRFLGGQWLRTALMHAVAPLVNPAMYVTALLAKTADWLLWLPRAMHRTAAFSSAVTMLRRSAPAMAILPGALNLNVNMHLALDVLPSLPSLPSLLHQLQLPVPSIPDVVTLPMGKLVLGGAMLFPASAAPLLGPSAFAVLPLYTVALGVVRLNYELIAQLPHPDDAPGVEDTVVKSLAAPAATVPLLPMPLRENESDSNASMTWAPPRGVANRTSLVVSEHSMPAQPLLIPSPMFPAAAHAS